VLHSPDFTPRTPGSIDEKQTASELLRLLCLSPLLDASPNLCVTETTPVASSLILDRVQYHSRPVFTASATLPAACIPNRQSPHLRICHSLLDLCQPPATLDLSIGPCHGYASSRLLRLPLRIPASGLAERRCCHSSLLLLWTQ
jgi:hypothetical protein